jgi:hypothetical protein
MKEEMWGEEHFLVRYEMWLPTVKFGTQKSLASKPSHWPVTSKPSCKDTSLSLPLHNGRHALNALRSPKRS